MLHVVTLIICLLIGPRSGFQLFNSSVTTLRVAVTIYEDGN
jgi:hypothetical protein